jgi:hypothetical protein
MAKSKLKSVRVKELKDRIAILQAQLYIPPEGRMGGSWEDSLNRELQQLKSILYYVFGEKS